jgi:hypothetical protein
MSSEFGANDAEHTKSGLLLYVAIGKLCNGVRGDGGGGGSKHDETCEGNARTDTRHNRFNQVSL